MKLTFCDCCNRQIDGTEKLYSIEITRHYGNPVLDLADVCEDCYQSIHNAIHSIMKVGKTSE